MAAAPLDISPLILPFARGVVATLDLWPALTIAIAEEWGGRDSAEKKPWMASILIDEFESRFNPADLTDLPLDEDEIADLVGQMMSDEFDCTIDDGSIEAVAADLIKLWKALITNSDEGEKIVQAMEARAAKAGKAVQATRGQEQEGLSSDEDDSDDGDDDEVMEAPQLVDSTPRERLEKVVDDDGFELVQKKGRR